MFSHLLKSFKIRKLSIKNRIIIAPMATCFGTSYGGVTDKLIKYHERRAEGGVGLNIVEFASVSPHGRMFQNVLGIFDDSFLDGMKALSSAIHKKGGKAALQIGHGGRRVSYGISGVRPMAPSPIPCMGGDFPREMNQDDVKSLKEEFVLAALRAKKAGFDAIELNMCHGYLLHQFLSPASNKRVDEYGGDILGRAKLPIEILDKVKAAAGENYPVFCRISAEERIAGGIFIEDSIEISKLLESHGADALHITAGMLETAELVCPPMAIEKGCYSNYARAIKEHVNIPVISVGRINTPFIAEKIVTEGRADLVSLGRPLIADPDFPNKVSERREKEIRPCISCNQGCIKRLYQNLDITCTVNPEVGIEASCRIEITNDPKNIAIVGGGPAGLEAARVLSSKGHKIQIFEKKDCVGGRLSVASMMPHREEISEYISYLKYVLERQNVTINTGKAFNKKVLGQNSFDVVLLAAGSDPDVPDIRGLDKVIFIQAEETPEKLDEVGSNICIIGGGSVGCEIAEFLALRDRRVTVIEITNNIAKDMEIRTRKLLLRRLSELKVDLIPNAKIAHIDQKKLTIIKGTVPNVIRNVDTIILATGYHARSIKAEFGELERVIDIQHLNEIDDALCAIHAGFHVAYNF